MCHYNVSGSLQCCIGIIGYFFLTQKIIKVTSPSRTWRYRSRAKRNTVSTFRWWTVAADRCESFKQIDGQIKNLMRNCFYFEMMICCCKQMRVLQINWWTGGEREEETVSTLRWWLVADTGAESFKQIDGQLENWRRKSCYFAMMICCCWWISVIQGHLGTGREPKETLLLLCNDDLLLLMDLRPSKTFRDRSRTKGNTPSTLRWWSVAADGSPSFKDI